MKIISPDLLIAKFIKSATNGRVVTIRTRRVLTLILIPVWLLGLFFTIPIFYEGCKAANAYLDAKTDRGIRYQDLPEDYYVGHEMHKSMRERFLRNSHPEDTLTAEEWNIIEGKEPEPDWLKEQLESYTPPVNQAAIDDAKAGMFNLLALPLYVLIFFALPWIVLRLIFWVIDADKAKE